MWQALRRKQLAGFKFRPQVAIDRFVVDFRCLRTKLIIEVDGEIHASQHVEDAERDQKLASLGFRVLRFSNRQVLDQTSEVLREILEACESPSPRRLWRHPSPASGRGAGGEGH